MSRIRTGIKPGQWLDEGPSSVRQSPHIGGEQVVGAPTPGAGRAEALSHLSNAERSDLPRCNKLMPMAKTYCDRPYGHGWNCMGRETIEAKKRRENRKKAA